MSAKNWSILHIELLLIFIADKKTQDVSVSHMMQQKSIIANKTVL